MIFTIYQFNIVRHQVWTATDAVCLSLNPMSTSESLNRVILLTQVSSMLGPPVLIFMLLTLPLMFLIAQLPAVTPLVSPYTILASISSGLLSRLSSPIYWLPNKGKCYSWEAKIRTSFSLNTYLWYERNTERQKPKQF